MGLGGGVKGISTVVDMQHLAAFRKFYFVLFQQLVDMLRGTGITRLPIML